MTTKQIEEKLKKILGGSYGGPSISYNPDTDLFFLYQWFDAPVSEEELSVGKTLEELILNLDKQEIKKHALNKLTKEEKKVLGLL